MKKSPLLIVLGVLLGAFTCVSAVQAESVVDEVRFRFLSVTPSESGDLKLNGSSTPGDVDVNADLAPEVNLTHKFTPHVAAELILATTEHSVNTTGTAISPDGKEDLGNVSLLPPTLTAQYHFLPEGPFQPYVGAGVNYTLFYNEGTDRAGPVVDSVEYDNSTGWALQAGFDVDLDALSDRMALNVDVKKLYLNTDVTAQSGSNTVTADVDLDPLLFGVGVSYEI